MFVKNKFSPLDKILAYFSQNAGAKKIYTLLWVYTKIEQGGPKSQCWDRPEYLDSTRSFYFLISLGLCGILQLKSIEFKFSYETYGFILRRHSSLFRNLFAFL